METFSSTVVMGHNIEVTWPVPLRCMLRLFLTLIKKPQTVFCLSIVLKVESHRTRFYILQWQLGFFNTSCHAGGLWVMMHDMNSSSACSHTHTHVVIHHISCALHLLSPLHYQIFTKGRTSNQECQFPVKKPVWKWWTCPSRLFSCHLWLSDLCFSGPQTLSRSPE